MPVFGVALAAGRAGGATGSLTRCGGDSQARNGGPSALRWVSCKKAYGRAMGTSSAEGSGTGALVDLSAVIERWVTDGIITAEHWNVNIRNFI